MNKIRTELKVGVIAVFSIVILVWGLNFLKGRQFFKTPKQYHAIFTDLDGLLPRSNVFINGMKVGQVIKISYCDPSLKEFLVKFELASDIRLPLNSIAEVYSSDILGSRALRIVIGDDTHCFNEKDTLPSRVEKSMISNVMDKLEPVESLIKNTDSIALAFKNIFNETAQSQFRSSIEGLDKTLNNFAMASASMNDLIKKEKEGISFILKDVRALSSMLNSSSSQISSLIQNLSDISDSAARIEFHQLNRSLSSLAESLGKIEKGEGNIGMLLQRDSLYINLENSSKKLDLLLEDIKKNPRRYVKVSVF